MKAEHAWQATIGQLQLEMSKASFDTWVSSAQFLGYDEETSLFTIGVKNAYARDWLDDRLSAKLSRLLTGMIGTPVTTEIKVHSTNTSIPESEVQKADAKKALLPNEITNINSRYRFDNFVVGADNRLAHAACMAVAESPARAYNPLFLYGGVGLGKTHLLHAIGNACQPANLNVLYVSSEEFTNDLINAIRTHTTPAFREKYRQIDVLLIDDIQFIAGKESTQEEFFHTFNTLHGQNKQIVISSDRSPKALVTLEERLRSRFEWGLTADIQPPDVETRLAILRAKAERAGRQVPADILEMIARQVQSNIRELEGALNRVLAYSDLTGVPLTLELAHNALTDFLPQGMDLQPDDVLDEVSKTFGVSNDRLLGRERTREVALPRQIAMYLMREEGGVSLPQIGEIVGGRDHTTVIYACDKVNNLMETDEHLRRQILQIRERLYGRVSVAI
ncbi:MAG: chromosomal replication initiator protein DnaA [Brevefilum sp.]|nr:chromosomal replication initiator protein DnaA [Brevefilum sp.]MDT8382478.1 chromosomal replication initiator protein DnaA [Brevefilum sp.]MDW7754842.1 chromosomal replication initiator protein DnaA [Brevefilum sp.]